MFKVIINKGLGFTEITKTFKTAKEACNFAIDFEIIRIYKDNKRIF